MQTLQYGSTGDEVKTLQEDLNTKGAHLVVDGDFGPATQAAVKVFQKDHGLNDDGIVGPLTWGALEATQPTPTPQPEPAPAPAPVPEPTPQPAPSPAPVPTPTPAPTASADGREIVAVIQGDVQGDTFHFTPQGKLPDGTWSGVGHLLLDTGAECLLLAQNMANAFGCPHVQDTNISGVTGSSPAYTSTISLKFGDVEFPDQFCIVDPSYQGWDDGLFGLKFFVDNGLDVDLDLQAGTLTLYKKVTK